MANYLCFVFEKLQAGRKGPNLKRKIRVIDKSFAAHSSLSAEEP